MRPAVRQVEKPWGVRPLPPPFAQNVQHRIGEIWFEPSEILPQLLIKYIFTSEKLSVQVHPSDTQTLAAGLGRQGKEECWLVIAAEPGATLGIGFQEAFSPQAIRAAALSGAIEDMLVWHPVQPGDFFYIPANVVHAIGGGVSLIEIQQNSDITYRLYDYGRPRELHLDEAMAVARGDVYDRALWHRHVDMATTANLVEGPYFRLDHVVNVPDAAVLARYEKGGALAVLPLQGDMVVAGDTLSPGVCAVVQDLASVRFADGGRCLLTQPFTRL